MLEVTPDSRNALLSWLPSGMEDVVSSLFDEIMTLLVFIGRAETATIGYSFSVSLFVPELSVFDF